MSIYFLSLSIDDVRRTREERNLRLRARRAEMSDERKEEMRRKQREYSRQYRQRKNAESQKSALCLDKENIQPNDTSNGTTTTSRNTEPMTIGKYRIHDMNYSRDTRCHSILIYITATNIYYCNNLYEMSLYFNIYCNKYNAGNFACTFS